MTEKEQKAFDQMREALLGLLLSHAMPSSVCKERPAHDAAYSALTAANAVSHPKAETAPATEGGAITSESAANAVSAKPNKYHDLTSCPWCDSTNRTVRKIRMGIVKCAHDWHTDEQAHPQATEPAGYKLVPVEPSVAMYDAARNHCADYEFEIAQEIYRAMLAAAPEANQ